MSGPRTVMESRPAIAPPEAPLVASGQVRGFRNGQRAMHWLAVVLPPVLIGYALFDKAFAYIRIPGSPIYAGEFLMLLSLAAAGLATGYLHRGLEHSTVAKLLLVFAGWGVLRTLPYLGADGINAVRDAAIWYYALLAIPVCALVISDHELLFRWAHGYRRFIPWLLVFSPFAAFLASHSVGLDVMIPGSGVSIWEHKPGNIAVQTTIAIAFLWLVPGMAGRFRPALTALATIVVLIVATQNRSGFVAAVAGLGFVWLFSRRRGRMTFGVITTVFVVIAVAWGINLQIKTQGGRTVSVGQFAQNVKSLTGGNDASAPGNLQANKQFREKLWSAAIKKVKTDKKVLIGLGFGPDLANELGFASQGPAQLRSPHNSHIDIFARMGAVGLGLWGAIWGFWYFVALRTRKRLRVLDRLFEKGLVEVCIVGVTAILVNAYFDPTLESPPVAIWLWTLVGIALGLAAISRANVLVSRRVSRPASVSDAGDPRVAVRVQPG